MHALNTTIEVERLYIELGECIQANDQEGVQRIFAALVRAKRPLTEIVGEVKRLSRAGVRSEAEPEPSVTDEWPQPGIAPQPLEPAPEPTPQPTYANFAGASMPPASPLSPDSAATWASERDAPVLRQWPPGDATSEAVPSNAEAELRSVDPAMSFDLPDHPEIAAAPAISDVEPASSWQDEWARPEALPDPEQSIAEPEQSTPAPIHQLFEPAIELETAGQAVTAAIVEEDPAASPGPATQQNPPAELEQGTPDTAPQISGRAIALGVGLDSSEGADTTQSKRASGPLAGRLAVALAIITVLAGAAAFLLVFARIGTMLMLLPGLGELMVPARVRLTSALVLAAVMMPLHRAAYQIDLQSIGPVLVMLGEELLVGAVLGMTARLTIAALQVTGSVVAQQLGLGFVTAVDPTQGQQGVILGNFLTILGIALLFATNLHHLVIAALDDSYTLFVPGEVPLTGDMAALMTRTLAGAFRVGVQLSAPFLVFGLLFNLGLGLLSRLMPQMQVFFVGMPLSILAGLMLLFLLLSAMMGTYMGSVESVLRDLAPHAGAVR